MKSVEARLEALGLTLPPRLPVPPGVSLPFPWVSVRGDRVFVSGHGPQNDDGTLAGPFGQLGAEVSEQQGYGLARRTGLAILSSLQRELGDLDRIAAWCRVFGMVNSAPGFGRQPAVINGFSDLILELFGPDVGRHTRSAVGMAALPFGMAVEIEAELLIRP
ncbi:MAG: RidA family protein [Burkholderiales bacterium]|nr:MAG: RidA family protein [Burkholderiales bacterium]